MKSSPVKILSLSAAAIALTFSIGATANAGGYYGGGYYSGHGGYYNAGYRHGHRGYHRRHGGGGKGAAIALGVIGGAILLSEAAKAEERRRYEERRYESRYYDRYDRYRTDRGRDYDRDAFERGYEEGRTAARGGDAAEENSATDSPDGLDAQLEGRADADVYARDGGPEPIRFSAAQAFQTCTKHARRALSERGFILAAPDTPDTAEDQGGSWKMTANVQAANNKGESWNRAMYCEADATRVYLLELI